MRRTGLAGSRVARMRVVRMRAVPGLATALVAVAALAGCTGQASSPEPTIALLLPESKTARYEGIDRPVFERVVAERCPGCRVLYANAGQDAAVQQAQAESALTQGATVLVLGAVDAVAARSIVTQAAARDVAVIAYDRFIDEVPLDYLVAYDAELVGALQAQALVDAVGEPAAGHGVLQVNGAATDPNAVAQQAGAAQVLAAAGLTVLAAYDTPDWSPDKAQEWVQGQLTQYAGRVVGVLAANDGTAAGAISALRGAGLSPVPPVTGQDAELAAVQRIVAGDQAMTVFKAIPQQARTAAELAVRLGRGEEPASAVQVQGVPAVLLAPVAVTRKDVADVIVAGGVYTAAQICTAPYAAACAELGLGGG